MMTVTICMRFSTPVRLGLLISCIATNWYISRDYRHELHFGGRSLDINPYAIDRRTSVLTVFADGPKVTFSNIGKSLNLKSVPRDFVTAQNLIVFYKWSEIFSEHEKYLQYLCKIRVTVSATIFREYDTHVTDLVSIVIIDEMKLNKATFVSSSSSSS